VDDFDVVTSLGAPADTLFQAGSISKPVTALVALELVAAGALSLDTAIADVLRHWQLPGDHQVTLRQLLGHTAGIGVPFFPGYEPDAEIPTLLEVLNGTGNTNTDPIRIEHGTGHFAYSGGGYAIVQQLIIEATAATFDKTAREIVFGPLAMSDSTFEQPLPKTSWDRAARPDWRIYPEAAAAGLWTTPLDLARFLTAIQHTNAGHPSPLAHSSARSMLSTSVTLPEQGEWNVLPTLGLRAPDHFGLGLFLEGNQRFSHLGGAAGFYSLLSGSTSNATGGIIMSAADPSPLLFQLALALSDEHQWQGFKPN
jgi:CubicO group peptidase (beta-lactamase class C family)